jgi:Copper transport outer membrane protein, MctB
MFDFRYHVVSLAAVFVALIIGILVGIGISGRGFVDKSERTRLQQVIDDLRNQRDDLRLQITQSQKRNASAQEYVKATYGAVMANRLKGSHVAILFVGHVDSDVRAAIDEMLDTADAAPAVRMRALKVPIDVRAVDRRLAGHPAFAQYDGDQQLDELGHELGKELALGGRTALWSTVSSVIVEERTGPAAKSADGVIVVRTAKPQTGPTSLLLTGLYAGLRDAGVPVVGVEASDVRPSAVSVFRRSGLSSVDDVDLPEGRLALALLLGGAPSGQYGLKPTATAGVLPRVEPVPAAGG